MVESAIQTLVNVGVSDGGGVVVTVRRGHDLRQSVDERDFAKVMRFASGLVVDAKLP